jgi:flagellar protein FlbD
MPAYGDKGNRIVIFLTRLDKSLILVNFDTVKYIEAAPDTIVSFVNGDTMIAVESLEEIDLRVLQYKARLLSLTKSDIPP